MSVIFIVLPLAIVMALLAVFAFVRATRSGQFDDLDTPPHRAIFDELDTRAHDPKP